MKNFLKFTNNPFKFETNYYLEDNDIIVTTDDTQYRRAITRTRIKYYESILEKQYKRLIDNQDEILQKKTDIKTTIYCLLAMSLCILSALSSEFSEILGMSLCGTSIATFIIAAIDNAIYSYVFKSKIKIYEVFLQERKSIETQVEIDKTIINHLSNKSTNILKHNQKLKQENLMDIVFSINFMDKASLQELKKILYLYSINNSDKSYIINDILPLKLIDRVNRIKKRIRRK